MNKTAVLIALGTSLLTGCSTKEAAPSQSLIVEDNQIPMQQASPTTDSVIDTTVTSESVGPTEYTSDYFSLSYPEDSIEINEWYIDGSTTLNLSMSNSNDYINIHYAKDYSYADYCNSLADLLTNYHEYYGSNAQIGKNALTARCFEYKSTSDYKVTFYLIPAKSGALVVEVGSDLNSHGESSAEVKKTVNDILDSILLNDEYAPSEYDYTSTKIVENTPSGAIQEY